MNKIGLTILILILFFTCASAVASDMNETVVTSEDQSDELIEIDNCDDSGSRCRHGGIHVDLFMDQVSTYQNDG